MLRSGRKAYAVHSAEAYYRDPPSGRLEVPSGCWPGAGTFPRVRPEPYPRTGCKSQSGFFPGRHGAAVRERTLSLSSRFAARPTLIGFGLGRAARSIRESGRAHGSSNSRPMWSATGTPAGLPTRRCTLGSLPRTFTDDRTPSLRLPSLVNRSAGSGAFASRFSRFGRTSSQHKVPERERVSRRQIMRVIEVEPKAVTLTAQAHPFQARLPPSRMPPSLLPSLCTRSREC